MEHRIKVVEDKLDKLTNICEDALIMARESTTPSLSKMLLEIHVELKKINEWQKSYEPVLQETQRILSGGKFVRTFTVGMANFLLSIGAIIGIVYSVKMWFRK